jgi:hypothetical protein
MTQLFKSVPGQALRMKKVSAIQILDVLLWMAFRER